jgi:DNA (cytosine-5)-methyltransferase 1
MSLTLYDEFAGWGGSSQGATAVPGVELVLAANHSPKAVEVHSLNFPAADHYLGDVTKADLARFPRADLFWASPACPPFSNARGQKQYFDAATEAVLFADPDETEAERSARVELAKRRALMEEVPRYLRAKAAQGNPVLAGVVENVPPARKWDQWNPWIRAIQTAAPAGYLTWVIALDSMHAVPVNTRPAPQSRGRLWVAYLLAAIGRTPDWDKWLRPPAYCPTCDQIVAAVQTWKRPGVDMGVYGAHGQYLYRCPVNHGAWKGTRRPGVVEPFVLPAAAAIDWTLPPGAKIGERVDGKGRPDPLKPSTMARIEAGLAKVAARALLVPAGGTWRTDAFAVDGRPLPSRTTRETDALVVPPLLVPTTARAGKTAHTADRPLRTQTARQETALVIPPTQPGVPAFISPLRGGGSKQAARGVDEPLYAFSAHGTHHALIQPPTTAEGSPARTGDLLVPYYGNGTSRPVTTPVGTFTAKDRWALLGVPTTQQTSAPPGHRSRKTGTAAGDTLPIPGLTDPDAPVDDSPRQELQVEVPAVEDCTFRMLTPREIAAGMAFHPDYQVTGSQRDQVAGFGNAVTPPAAEVLVSALVEAITGEPLPGPRGITVG